MGKITQGEQVEKEEKRPRTTPRLGFTDSERLGKACAASREREGTVPGDVSKSSGREGFHRQKTTSEATEGSSNIRMETTHWI